MLAHARSEEVFDDEAEVLEAAAIPARLSVPAGNDGERLDKVMARLLPDQSRTRIKQWIDAGAVRLNGALANPRAPVFSGDTLDLAPPPSPQETAFHPESIPLAIVHEDEAIIVIDKPPGLVVHPAAGNWSGTLLNGLLAHDPRLARLPRAGIVHRLDAGTSGLMVVAKSAAAQVHLVRQLQARTVTREYWAIVCGESGAAGAVNEAIVRDPRQPVRFKVSTAPKAKPARTRYQRVAARVVDGRHFAWLACRLETGRTHQIRVHLESIGLPLVGDPVYRRGRRTAPKSSTAVWATFARQALHAYRLGLVHPASGLNMQWTTRPPADMRDLMTALGFDPSRRVEQFK